MGEKKHIPLSSSDLRLLTKIVIALICLATQASQAVGPLTSPLPALDHLKGKDAVDGPARRSPHDCVLPARLDPRYFNHPRLETFLSAVEEGQSRRSVEMIREMSAINAFDTGAFTVEPTTSNAELLNLSYAMYRLSLPDVPPGTNLIDRRRLVSLRVEVEREIATRFRGQPFLLQREWQERRGTQVLDWARIEVTPAASLALLRELMSGTGMVLPVGDSANFLATWEAIAGGGQGQPAWLRWVQRSTVGNLAEHEAFQGLSWVQYAILRENLLNLYESASRGRVFAEGMRTPLINAARNSIRDEDRPQALLEERRQWCRFFAPGSDNPDILDQLGRLREAESDDYFRIGRLRALNEFVASHHPSGPHGLPIEVRRRLAALPLRAIGRLSQVAWAAVDQRDRENAIRLLFEADGEKLGQAPGATLRAYLHPSGHEPYFARAATRDSNFLKAIASKLGGLKQETWNVRSCRQTPTNVPLVPPAMANWQTLPHDGVPGSLSKGAIFRSVLHFLQPTNAGEIEASCERQREPIRFRSAAGKANNLLLMEEETYQTNPHRLVAMYQLIGLYLGWQATPAQIAQDILEHFPETRLAELRRFHEDRVREGDRFDEISRDLSFLVTGPSAPIRGEENIRKLRALRERLREVPGPSFYYTLQNLVETLAQNPGLLDAIEIGAAGMTLNPTRLREQYGVHGAPPTSDPKAGTRAHVPWYSKEATHSVGTVVTIANPLIGQFLKDLYTTKKDESAKGRAAHLAQNATIARELLKEIPNVAPQVPLPARWATRQQWHQVFGDAYKARNGESLADRFQGPMNGPPSASEIRAVRRLVGSAILAQEEGATHDLLEETFLRLQSPRLGLFNTEEKLGALDSLRTALRVLPVEALPFHLRVLEATLLKEPELLPAIRVEANGVTLNPARLPFFAYLAIPSADGAQKELARQYATRNAALASGILTEAREPSARFRTEGQLFGFFDKEYRSQYGKTLTQVFQGDNGGNDSHRVLGAVAHLLHADRLAFDADQYQRLDPETLFAMRSRVGNQGNGGIWEALRIPGLVEFGRHLLGGAAQNGKQPSELKVLRDQLQRSAALFSRDTSGEHQQLYRLISRDLERQAEGIRRQLAEHGRLTIPKSEEGQAAYADAEKLIQGALRSYQDARDFAQDYGYGNVTGTRGRLFRSPTVSLTFQVGKQTVTLKGVPSGDLGDSERSKHAYWLSVPTSSPSCDQAYHKELLSERNYHLCSAHSDAHQIRFGVSNWIGRMTTLLQQDPASFRVIVGHYRNLERSVLGQETTDAYHVALRELCARLFTFNSQPLIELESPSGTTGFNVMPGRLSQLEGNKDFQKLKGSIPLEILSQPWVTSNEKMSAPQVLQKLNEQLTAHNERVGRAATFAKGAQKDIQTAGGAGNLEERLRVLRDSQRPEDRQLLQDLHAYVRYFPESNTFRNLVYRNALPPHLMSLLRSTERRAPNSVKTFGEQFSAILDALPPSAIAREWMLHEGQQVPAEFTRPLTQAAAQALFERMNLQRMAHQASMAGGKGDSSVQVYINSDVSSTKAFNQGRYRGIDDHGRLVEALVDDFLKRAMGPDRVSVEALKELSLNFRGLETGLVKEAKETESRYQQRILSVIDNARGFFLNELCILQAHLTPPPNRPAGELTLHEPVLRLLNGNRDRASVERLYRSVESLVRRLDDHLAVSRLSGDPNYPFSPDIVVLLCDAMNANRGNWMLPAESAKQSGAIIEFYETELRNWLRRGGEIFATDAGQSGPYTRRNTWLTTPAIPIGAIQPMHPSIRDAISTSKGSFVVDPPKLREMVEAMERRLRLLRAGTPLGHAPAGQVGNSQDVFLRQLESAQIHRLDIGGPDHSTLTRSYPMNNYLHWAQKEFGVPFGGMSIPSVGALTRLPTPVHDMLTFLTKNPLGHLEASKTKDATGKLENARRKELAHDIAKVIQTPWPDEILRLVTGHDKLRAGYGRSLDEALVTRFRMLQQRKTNLELIKTHETKRDAHNADPAAPALTAFEARQLKYLVERRDAARPPWQLSQVEENERRMLMWITGCEMTVREGNTIVGTQNSPLTHLSVPGQKDLPDSRQAQRFNGFVPPENPLIPRQCKLAAAEEKLAKGRVRTRNQNSPSFGEVFAAIPSMSAEQRTQVRNWAAYNLVTIFNLERTQWTNEEAILKAAEQNLSRGVSIRRDQFDHGYDGNVLAQSLVILMNALDNSEGTAIASGRDRESDSLAHQMRETAGMGALRFDPRVVASREIFLARESTALQKTDPRHVFLESALAFRQKHAGGSLDATARRNLLRLSPESVRQLEMLQPILTNPQASAADRRFYHSLLQTADPQIIRRAHDRYGSALVGYEQNQQFDVQKVRQQLVGYLARSQGKWGAQNPGHAEMEKLLGQLVLHEANREFLGKRSTLALKGMGNGASPELFMKGALVDQAALPDRQARLLHELKQAAAVEVLVDSVPGIPKYISQENADFLKGRLKSRNGGLIDAFDPLRDQLNNSYTLLSNENLLRERVRFENQMKEFGKGTTEHSAAASNLALVLAAERFRRENPALATQVETLKALLLPGDVTEINGALNTHLLNAITAAEMRLLRQSHLARVQAPATDSDRFSWKAREGESDAHANWRKATETKNSPLATRLASSDDEKLRDQLWEVWQTLLKARQQAIDQVIDGKVTIRNADGCSSSPKAAVGEGSQPQWQAFLHRRQQAIHERNAKKAQLTETLRNAISQRNMLEEKWSGFSRLRGTPDVTKEQRDDIQKEMNRLQTQISQEGNRVRNAYKDVADHSKDDQAFNLMWGRNHDVEKQKEITRRQQEIECLFNLSLSQHRQPWLALRGQELDDRVRQRLQEAAKGGAIDYSQLLGALDPQALARGGLLDIRSLQSAFVDLFAPQLVPPHLRENRDITAFRDYLSRDLRDYFDQRERLQNFARAAAATSPGNLSNVDWMETPLANREDWAARPNAMGFAHLSPQETRRILDAEWRRLTESRTHDGAITKRLEDRGIKVIGSRLDFTKAKLWGVGEKGLEQLLKDAHALLPVSDPSGLQIRQNPWEQFQDDLIQQYITSGMKPLFQLGEFTAVETSYNAQTGRYAFTFHDAEAKKRQALVLARGIHEEFDRIVQEFLPKLRAQNNRWAAYFGFVNDSEQRRAFDLSVAKLRPDIERLRAFGTLFVDPQFQYYQGMVADPSHVGGRRLGNVRLPWMVSEPAGSAPKERFPRLTDSFEDRAYQSADSLARLFDWQIAHRVGLDARRTLEKIDADQSAMTRELIVSAVVVAASALVPPLAPNAALLVSALHGARTAVALHWLSEAFNEATLPMAIHGAMPSFLGDAKQALASGHSDTEADFYKSIGMFMGQSAAAQALNRALGIGKLGVTRLPTLPANASTLQRVGHFFNYARARAMPYLRHYGGQIGVGVSTMHVSSMISDVVVHYLKEGHLPNGEQVEDFFYHAIGTDLFALGADREAAGMLPGGNSAKARLARVGLAFLANHFVHGVAVLKETSRELEKSNTRERDLRKRLAESVEPANRTALQQEIDDLLQQREQITFMNRWAGGLVRESVTLGYFALHAGMAPSPRLPQRIAALRIGDGTPPTREANRLRAAGEPEPGSYDAWRRSLLPDLTAELRQIETQYRLRTDGTEIHGSAFPENATARETAMARRTEILKLMDAEAGNFLQGFSIADLNELRRRAFPGNVSPLQLRGADLEQGMRARLAAQPPEPGETAPQRAERLRRMDESFRAFSRLAESLGVEATVLAEAMARQEANLKDRAGEARRWNEGQAAANPVQSWGQWARGLFGLSQTTENGGAIRTFDTTQPMQLALPEVLAEARRILRDRLATQRMGTVEYAQTVQEIAQAEESLHRLDAHDPTRVARFEIPLVSELPVVGGAVTPHVTFRGAYQPTWFEEVPFRFFLQPGTPHAITDAAVNAAARRYNIDGPRFMDFARRYRIGQTPAEANAHTWASLVETYRRMELRNAADLNQLVTAGRLTLEDIRALYGDSTFQSVSRLRGATP